MARILKLTITFDYELALRIEHACLTYFVVIRPDHQYEIDFCMSPNRSNYQYIENSLLHTYYRTVTIFAQK